MGKQIIMKQIIQNLKTGQLILKEVPYPLCKPDGVIVKNLSSLVSIGTERSIIDLANKSLIGKVKARPDLFKRAWEKAKKEGFLKVFKESMSRLDEPFPLGYSASGEVSKAGSNVKDLSAGDRVAIIGSGYANHAEYNYVPKSMCFKLSKENGLNIDLEEAAFCMVGGIAINGINEAELEDSDSVAVIGLGLLGLLTIQVLKAKGCKVIGIDISSEKLKKAKELGCENLINPNFDNAKDRVLAHTGFKGTDSVIITAASKDNSPIDLAQQIAGQRARIVLVGVSNINLDRKYFWDKELVFKVSKAAGSQDSERKNIEHFLQLVSQGKINLQKLISHRIPFQKVVSAYDNLLKGKESFIGVLLKYQNTKKEGPERKVQYSLKRESSSRQTKNVGVVGGGQFAKNILLPYLNDLPGINKVGIVTTRGITADHIANKFGFEYSSTDYRTLIEDKKIDNVFILTRHDLHARLVIEALKNGKNVFVEKPLCLNKKELQQIILAYQELTLPAGRQGAKSYEPKIMVGFNRKYSLHARDIKSFFDNREPLIINYRINAGFIPSDHWTHNKDEGGGRIIGEVCHFVDFLQFVTSSQAVEVYTVGIGKSDSYHIGDNIITIIKFKDGSVANITYTSKGNKSYPREIIEVYQSDSVYYLEDFRKAVKIKSGKRKRLNISSQNMGYKEELEYFFSDKSINFQDYISNSLTVFSIKDSLDNNKIVRLNFEF